MFGRQRATYPQVPIIVSQSWIDSDAFGAIFLGNEIRGDGRRKMSDDNRVPLFVRIPPSLKTDVADRAWRERMSVSRLVEDALRERLSKGEVTREAV